MPSIALSCNVYQDAAALKGLLETSGSFFDNIYIIHSSPGGVPSTDGTMEVLEEYGIKPVMADINEGFGVIRSRLIHDCGCEWAFILDADERFHRYVPRMNCLGNDIWTLEKGFDIKLNLTVTKEETLINQGSRLRELIANPRNMAVRSIRRHWLDLEMNEPTQNWFHVRDHQLRIVRNHPSIGYKSEVKMHERLIDSRTGSEPVFAPDHEYNGIFHDHFHCHYRKLRPGHKQHNEVNWGKLTRGEPLIPNEIK